MRYVLKKLGWTLCRNINEAASIVSVNRVCHWNFSARFSGNHGEDSYWAVTSWVAFTTKCNASSEWCFFCLRRSFLTKVNPC